MRICEVHCVSEVRRWQVKLSGTSEVCDASEVHCVSEDEEKNSFVALYNFLSACYNLPRVNFAGTAVSEPQGGDRIERRT